MSAHGRDDDDPEPFSHRLLGEAMRVLHARPVLDLAELGPAPAGAAERVRVTLQPLSLEEMTKLWTIFQTPYRLSVVYEATVVLIDLCAGGHRPWGLRADSPRGGQPQPGVGNTTLRRNSPGSDPGSGTWPGTPDADAGDAGSGPLAALEDLARQLGLSGFEREVVLLCVAMELDTGVASLCACAHGDAGQPYPTFALALTLFEHPTWDALRPTGRCGRGG